MLASASFAFPVDKRKCGSVHDMTSLSLSLYFKKALQASIDLGLPGFWCLHVFLHLRVSARVVLVVPVLILVLVPCSASYMRPASCDLLSASTTSEKASPLNITRNLTLSLPLFFCPCAAPALSLTLDSWCSVLAVAAHAANKDLIIAG